MLGTIFNMGVWTEYDVIGKPSVIFWNDVVKDGAKKYNWQTKVRVVLEDGTVTKIGVYDGKEYGISEYSDLNLGYMILITSI